MSSSAGLTRGSGKGCIEIGLGAPTIVVQALGHVRRRRGVQQLLEVSRRRRFVDQAIRLTGEFDEPAQLVLPIVAGDRHATKGFPFTNENTQPWK